MSQTLAEGLSNISKFSPNELDAYLTTVCHVAELDETLVKINCHHVALDGSDLPRLADLTDAVASWIIDYAIPRRAIDLINEQPVSTRARKFVELQNQAKHTFKTKGMSGEQGEMLMFVLAEAILGLPQLLCKMDLKTDPEMHFHGLDGVHCGATTEGHLAVYWCESKVHKNVSKATSEALDGLKPFLLSSGTGDSDKKRELALLDRYMDLGDAELKGMVLNSLNPAKPEFNNVDWRGICFVGFDSDLYPTDPKSKSKSVLLEQVTEQLSSLKKSLKVKVKNRGLQVFDIHFIYVPFGFCEDFRKEMHRSLSVGV
ncbi:MAG: hypothetical protein COA43_04825 [Robiginitomaculum sp.]|nr:MAG: hypothetical protein COA43_04825 [Robiginitomaculum sp.]